MRFLHRMLRVGGLAACAAIALGGAECRAQGAARQPADTDRIDITTYVASPPHPITLDEIVSLRTISEPRRSPDGKQVAFFVRQGFRDCNCYRTALYVVEALGGGRPRKLLEESSLSELRWAPDGQWISYLSSRSGTVQLWRIPPTGGKAQQLFTHRAGDADTFMRRGWAPTDQSPAAGVLSYEWAPDGRAIAFTATLPTDTAAKHRVARTGARYDDRTMVYFNILFDQWTESTTELWLYDVGAGREQRLWRAPPSAFDGSISQIAWSPGSDRIAVSYVAPPIDGVSRLLWNVDVGIVGRNGTFTPVAAGGAWEEDPTWSPDGGELAITSSLNLLDSTRVLTYDLRTRVGRTIAAFLSEMHLHGWTRDGRFLLADGSGPGLERELAGYYQIPIRGGATRRLTPSALAVTHCDDAARMEAACIRQAPNVPPAVAIVRLDADSGDQRVRPIATADPELRDITLSSVSEMRWRNALGQETNGFLIRPAGARPGRRYPLVIIVYGFTGEFVTQASSSLTSYPAQLLAQNGFAVLLANPPRSEPWNGKDFARGRTYEGDALVSTIDSAVRRLVADGLVDSTRVGMMGSSFGCFWIEYVITHSSLLRTASVRNGGDYNPGEYWLLGNAFYRDRYERYLGGPPYDSTLANWQRFSPALNADRAHGPVLMEFDPMEALLGLEMYAALRRHDVPVDFWVYPGDGHVLLQPEHRYYSMSRNLDWFNFWLQGSVDSSEAKAEQYARWRGMHVRR